jgi:hypothetical protein
MPLAIKYGVCLKKKKPNKDLLACVRNWPKCEARVVRPSVSFGEIARLLKNNSLNFEIRRGHSQQFLQSRPSEIISQRQKPILNRHSDLKHLGLFRGRRQTMPGFITSKFTRLVCTRAFVDANPDPLA